MAEEFNIGLMVQSTKDTGEIVTAFPIIFINQQKNNLNETIFNYVIFKVRSK